MKLFSGLLILLLCFRASGTTAQNRQADSISRLLQTTHSPTSRIPLCYHLWVETQESRISRWDSLLARAHEYNMPAYESMILDKTGTLYSAQGLITEALIAFNQGLKIAEKYDQKKELLVLYKSLEVFWALQFDRKRSLYYSYKGLRLAEALNDKKSIADFYALVAVHYLTSGDLDKALKMHFICLKKCREIGYDNGIAGALLDVGSAYAAMGRKDLMVPYYLESRKYIPKVAELVHVVQIYSSACEAYLTLNKNDSAYLYADSAFRLATRINNKRAIASTMLIIGRMAYHNGNITAAKTYLKQSLDLVLQSRFMAQLPTLYGMFKEIYVKEGNYREALKYHELYIRIEDSLSNEQVRKQAMEKEFEYNLSKKEDEFKLLVQRNQIQELKIRKDQYLFIGLGLVLFAITMITFLLVRQSRLRTANQQIVLEQKLLRSQMNPHFVFNSLNSIQQLIMKRQNDDAELYLSKFSQLIRDLLESTTRENLPVKEEVGMLDAYLGIESLRFGGRFSYTIRIDEKIDTTNTYIPHLMIQPFAENAIWHGLLSKGGDGMLQIGFEYDTDKTIRCIVDDNGIGREASMKKQSTFRKKSLALSFVDQRIELMKRTGKAEGSIQIIDKKNNNNESMGTTVIIVLPFAKTADYDTSNYC